MSRKTLPLSKVHFYHIRGKANGPSEFYVSREMMWKFLLREMSLLEKEFYLEVFAIVLLKNEFHLILRTPTEPLSKIMFYLMSRLTRKIQKATGRINHIFGGTYKGCLLGHDELAKLVSRYLHQLQDEEEYCILKEPPSDDQFLSRNEMISIEWGLRRTEFRFLKDRSNGNRPIIPRCHHTSVVAPS